VSHADAQQTTFPMYVEPPSDGPWKDWELQTLHGRRVEVDYDAGGDQMEKVVAEVTDTVVLGSGGACITLRVVGGLAQPPVWITV